MDSRLNKSNTELLQEKIKLMRQEIGILRDKIWKQIDIDKHSNLDRSENLFLLITNKKYNDSDKWREITISDLNAHLEILHDSILDKELNPELIDDFLAGLAVLKDISNALIQLEIKMECVLKIYDSKEANVMKFFNHSERNSQNKADKSTNTITNKRHSY